VDNITGSGGAGSYFVQGDYTDNATTNASSIAYTYGSAQIA
jgi:hypothetical protein